MVTRTRKTRPEIVEIPAQRMAVIYTRGDPNQQQDALSALYGAVYSLKFARQQEGRDFTVGPLRARWPDAHLLKKGDWLGIWGLPLPDDVRSVPRTTPGFDVTVERWSYDTVAQVVHTGSYTDEEPVVAALHAFIEESGYQITGVHEEEYLTTPDARVQQTIIRYPVQRKGLLVPRDIGAAEEIVG